MVLNTKKAAPYLILAVFFIFLDRLLKILAINFYFIDTYELIGKYLQFSLAKNYYIAFSIPFSGILLNIIISILILFILLYLLILNTKQKYKTSGLLIFVVFGAISNLIDRLKYGFVIDYLDLKYFTVFNVADIMIVCGIFSFFVIYHLNNQSQNR